MHLTENQKRALSTETLPPLVQIHFCPTPEYSDFWVMLWTCDGRATRVAESQKVATIAEALGVARCMAHKHFPRGRYHGRAIPLRFDPKSIEHFIAHRRGRYGFNTTRTMARVARTESLQKYWKRDHPHWQSCSRSDLMRAFLQKRSTF